MSTPAVDQAFLNLITVGDDLLQELLKGGVKIEGALRQRIDAYRAAHAQAKDIVPQVRTPASVQEPNTVFDGGPESNPPPQAAGQGEAQRTDD